MIWLYNAVFNAAALVMVVAIAVMLAAAAVGIIRYIWLEW